MTNQAPPPMPRPTPIADEASQPFFDAAAEGKLLLRFCAKCQRFMTYSAEFCDNCLASDLEWKAASGKGTVYSYVVMHQVLHPGFAAEVPYNVIVVETDEGPRLQSNLLGTADAGINVGMRVEVTCQPAGDVSVPYWKAAS
jgi:uncharacterized OB-fold protein